MKVKNDHRSHIQEMYNAHVKEIKGSWTTGEY